jgi:hypothetical protein
LEQSGKIAIHFLLCWQKENKLIVEKGQPPDIDGGLFDSHP